LIGSSIKQKKTPAGRTLEYRLYRACERFGQPPEYLDSLDREAKMKLIGFESIREEEEIELATIMIPKKD
jgi:hypothetical protein